MAAIHSSVLFCSLDPSLWRKAKPCHDQQQQQQQQQERASSPSLPPPPPPSPPPRQDAARDRSRETHFASILQVPVRERDQAHRMQTFRRASAALTAAQALLAELELGPRPAAPFEAPRKNSTGKNQQDLLPFFSSKLTVGDQATPGADFSTWYPSSFKNEELDKMDWKPFKTQSSYVKPLYGVVLEKPVPTETLDIVCESVAYRERDDLSFNLKSRKTPMLPPLQSLVESQREGTSEVLFNNVPFTNAKHELEETSTMQTELHDNVEPSSGLNSDGSRWWRKTGEELNDNGVIYRWTLTRGVNVDGEEWEEKFWEAFDQFDYKELGAEKSGCDANGNIWHEVWKETMWQDLTTGLSHIEKMAEKWGKQKFGEEWHEKWLEHYDASGFTEKSADKWCKIDPATPLEPGHAHVWHERWGETYDGQGGSTKYTDKWAERADCTGKWSKWGDKWDEHFDKYRHGVKQGETWWEGEHGERWNRTWGEEHNGTGWIHKYGKSSSGEHWDTHVKQETWYERYPHYGFNDCFQNLRELRRVGTRKKSSF